MGPPAALAALPYLASLKAVFQFLNNGTLPLVVITLQRPVTTLDLCSAPSHSALPHWPTPRLSTSAQPRQFSDTSGFHGYDYEIFDRGSACDSLREQTMLSPMASFGKSGRYSPHPILHCYLPACSAPVFLCFSRRICRLSRINEPCLLTTYLHRQPTPTACLFTSCCTVWRCEITHARRFIHLM